MPIPYVFIFDIDQCILGNVHHLVEEYHLYTELKELYGERKIPYVNTFKDDMKNRVSQKLDDERTQVSRDIVQDNSKED